MFAIDFLKIGMEVETALVAIKIVAGCISMSEGYAGFVISIVNVENT